jgi:hypothetical protein
MRTHRGGYVRDDLRRVRGEEELAPWERVPERGHDHTLPAGMQVQVHLVDHDDAGSFERIGERGVRDREAPRQVADEGEQALLPVRELVEREILGTLGHHHPHRRGGAADAEILEAVEELRDGPADRVELAVAPIEIGPLLFVCLAELFVLDVLTELEPLEEEPEVPQRGLVERVQLLEGVFLNDRRDLQDGAVDGIMGDDRNAPTSLIGHCSPNVDNKQFDLPAAEGLPAHSAHHGA